MMHTNKSLTLTKRDTKSEITRDESVLKIVYEDISIESMQNGLFIKYKVKIEPTPIEPKQNIKLANTIKSNMNVCFLGRGSGAVSLFSRRRLSSPFASSFLLK